MSAGVKIHIPQKLLEDLIRQGHDLTDDETEAPAATEATETPAQPGPVIPEPEETKTSAVNPLVPFLPPEVVQGMQSAQHNRPCKFGDLCRRLDCYFLHSPAWEQGLLQISVPDLFVLIVCVFATERAARWSTFGSNWTGNSAPILASGLGSGSVPVASLWGSPVQSRSRRSSGSSTSSGDSFSEFRYWCLLSFSAPYLVCWFC